MKKALEETSDSLPLLPLTELRTIQIRCEAVASCRVLGLAHDMRLQAISRAAKRAMPEEASDGLYALEAREKTIIGEIVAELQKQDLSDEVLNKEYTRAVGQSAEIREIQQAMAELWQQKVPFRVQPLTIPADGLPIDETGKLTMPESTSVSHRGGSFNVDPYAALLDLTADEIVILE